MIPLSTTQRINLGFALALLLVAATGTIAYRTTSRLAEVSAEVNHSHLVLSESEQLLANVVDAQSAQRGYVITGDSVLLGPFRNASSTVTGELRELNELLLHDPAQLQRLRRLELMTRRRMAYVDTVIAVRARGGFDAAAAIVRRGRGQELMDSLKGIVAGIQAVERGRLDRATERADAVSGMAQRTVAVGSLLAFLMVLLGAMAVRHEFEVRRRAETALRENETLLKQFMDALPIAAYVVDAHGRPYFANTTALTMLGRDALHREVDESALPLWRTGAAQPVRTADHPMSQALRGLAARAEDLELRVGERPLPVEITAAPVFDSEGQVAYGIAAFADVTERKRSQAALRAAKDAAELANQTKSEFLARMSHELRTPLNSIIGFANILLKKLSTAVPEKERTYLERILDNGKHLLLLINDILDLSKIEAGKVVIEKELVDLGTLVNEVLQQWDEQLRGGKVRLEARVPEGTAPVFTDRVRLRQILINLIGNAVKFTEKGFVRVEVRNGADTGRPHTISVVDSGIGIPQERLEAIFDAFEQAETSTSRKYGGTGLGLPISRALCELLGYDLTVSSTVDVGTEFIIHLSQSRARSDALAATSDSAAPLVLIIDDEDEARHLLTEHLEALGYRTVGAATGEQGINLARALFPQLITLDLLLPDMTGWEVLSRLKAEPGVATIPVVALTLTGADAGTLLGEVDALTKPVDRNALRAVLQRNLHGAGRVLVIEDDADMRELLHRMVQPEASEVREAADGKAALQLMQGGFSPDLILLDLVMPVLDGFAFMELLRHQPELRRIPIVVVTGRDLSGDEHQRLRNATVAVVKKGETLERDLRDVLRDYLPLPA